MTDDKIRWHLSAAAHLSTCALAHWRDGHISDALDNAREALNHTRIAEASLSGEVFRAALRT